MTSACVRLTRHMRYWSGPAQKRYGGYFGRVLHDPRLTQPNMVAKQLHQVVFSSLRGLNVAAADAAAAINDASVNPSFFDEDITPFLVVFQHGRRVFSGFAEVEVRLRCPPLMRLNAQLGAACPGLLPCLSPCVRTSSPETVCKGPISSWMLAPSCHAKPTCTYAACMPVPDSIWGRPGRCT